MLDGNVAEGLRSPSRCFSRSTEIRVSTDIEAAVEIESGPYGDLESSTLASSCLRRKEGRV